MNTTNSTSTSSTPVVSTAASPSPGAGGSSATGSGVSTLDLAFVGGFIAVALLIGFGGRRLSRVAYSRLLLLLALLMAAFIALYQYFDVGPEPENAALHATAMAFAQLGVYVLAFKLWLAINYAQMSRHGRLWMHLISHSAFAVAIFSGYWLKLQHPAVALLIYPLNSLSLSLIAQAIETARQERDES